MTDPFLDHPTLKVKQLIDEYRAGRIVIPEFQRDYVWQKRKAPLLVDSLYRGYPISSLLLWQSSDEVTARRREPRRTHASTTDWLIDGQQRVITLARTMSGDEGIEVVFHHRHDAFKLANAATRAEPGWVRVADLWDDELYRQFRRNLDGSPASDRREESYERVRRILEYEIPVVRMINHSFDAAVGAFNRINTQGVKLKKQDIESAQIASRHSGFIADDVAPFLAKLRSEGFDRLNIMHLFRACAFVAKPDGRNRTPLHELKRSEVTSAWNDTKRATDQAIGLIRSELGLVNMRVLWSGALLVPVIALCATAGPRQRNSKGVAAWLALAALLHRYSRASETALDQDLRACRTQDPIGALLSNLRTVRAALGAVPEDFSGALADRSRLLALYIACKQRGALDFFTDSRVLLQSKVDRHHILPRAQFEPHLRNQADNIANIAFVADDVNRSIGQSGPEVYLKQVKRRALESQCVPLDAELWRVDKAQEFWAARRELLAASFNGNVSPSPVVTP